MKNRKKESRLVSDTSGIEIRKRERAQADVFVQALESAKEDQREHKKNQQWQLFLSSALLVFSVFFAWSAYQYKYDGLVILKTQWGIVSINHQETLYALIGNGVMIVLIGVLFLRKKQKNNKDRE